MRSTYLERKERYYYAQNDPIEVYEDDYWIELALRNLETDKNAFCSASLIWIDEAAVDACLSQTTLRFSQICRSLLTVKDGKTKLHLIIQAKLETLPTGLSQLSNLQSLTLCLHDTEHLSSDFGQLNNLQCLDLYWHISKYLPADFYQLENLQSCALTVGGLEKLPNEIGSFRNLKCFLSAMDTRPGKGFIAAEIDPTSVSFFEIVAETSEQLEKTIQQFLPESSRAEISEQLEQIKTQNNKLQTV